MTTYTWNGGSGAWNVASNWTPSTGFPNAFGDEALITAAGTYTVTLSGASYSVGVLQTAAGVTVALQSATLSIYPSAGGADVSSLAGTISVDAASTLTFQDTWTTAQLGTIDAASGATLNFSGTLDNTGATLAVAAGVLLKGTIQSGTIEGAINLGDNDNLTLEGGPTLTGAGGTGAGVVNDTGASSTLRLQNTQTLANTTIDLGNATNYSYLNQADSLGGGQVATLASTVTVDVAGFGYFTGSSAAGDALDNKGAINVTTMNASLTISNPTFTNDGTIDVANASTLTFFNGSGVDLTNNGTITVDGTSTVTFEGLTTAQLGTVNAASGTTLDFAGTGLDNTGATYTPTTGVTLEGVISGGMIDGSLILSAFTTLGLANGPILTGPSGTGRGFIDDANGGSTLDLINTQTIDNTTILVANNNYITQVDANTVTTLGSGDIISVLGNATMDGNTTGAGFINQGVIDDNIIGGTSLTNYAYTFTNEGTMAFSYNNAFVVDYASGGNFVNSATGKITASVGGSGASYILFQDSIENDGTITVDGIVSPTQQAYVEYYYAVTGSGITDIANGGLANFFQTQTQSVKFTGGGGTLQLNANTNTGAVIGFTTGDTINLTGLLYDGGAVNWSLDDSTNVLSVSNATQTATVQLDPRGNFAGYVFHLADDFSGLAGGDGTNVTVTPCFCRGTRIATASGEIAVERLAIGDLVVTASGVCRPIRWIGHRELEIRRHAFPLEVLPVRVSAHAFGEGQPRRDIWLSPQHAVSLEGVLIPIIRLANGATIRQERVERVSYWHVELDSHDVLLAEGLAAESFLDCGSRSGFANCQNFVELHPTFVPQSWDDACAPLCETGPVVDAARKRLRARAEDLGFRLTQNPGLHIDADGETIFPLPSQDGVLRFDLPPLARRVKLVSLSFRPADHGGEDKRALGVPVLSLSCDGVTQDLAALGEGWHRLESDAGRSWRWTDGSAALPVGRRLALKIGKTPSYWVAAEEGRGLGLRADG